MNVFSVSGDLNLLTDIVAARQAYPVLDQAIDALRDLFGLPVVVLYRQVVTKTEVKNLNGTTAKTVVNIEDPTEFVLHVLSLTGVSLGSTTISRLSLYAGTDWHVGGTCHGMFVGCDVNTAWRKRAREIEDKINS